MGNPKMKVMVTGLSGLVGSRWRELSLEKYTLEGLDLTGGVDITQMAQVERIVGDSPAEVVVHLAAFTNVSAAQAQEGKKQGICYQVNVMGTRNITQACKKYGKYLIHISTDFVFDGLKETPYTEVDIPQPIEWYGKTKYLAEQEVQTQLDNYVILRLAYPYQARPTRPDFLTNLTDKLRSNALPPQFTDHTITPTFVDDVAEVFDVCIRQRPQGLYHMTGSSWHTDFEKAQIVKEAFGLTGEIVPEKLVDYLKDVKRPYQKTMKLSNAKLQQELGIKMKTFREGLEEIVGAGGNGWHAT